MCIDQPCITLTSLILIISFSFFVFFFQDESIQLPEGRCIDQYGIVKKLIIADSFRRGGGESDALVLFCMYTSENNHLGRKINLGVGNPYAPYP